MADQLGLTFEQVRDAHKECGSSRAAAKKLGCTPETVSYWLKGKGITKETKPFNHGHQHAVLHLRNGDALLDALRKGQS